MSYSTDIADGDNKSPVGAIAQPGPAAGNMLNEAPGLVFDSSAATHPPAAVAAAPYRVLARKYRPQSFSALIGQDAMVQTLANAIKRDRLAHAFLMTGVRGVGKTSTARLIAKALNCIGTDGTGSATIDPCGQCEPCVAIAEGRHIDVIEMDAASHTGIDDVREIIEAVRYSAVSARYKIYIIDEVHMLSRQAFNGLLKTLEEPPGHVKFLFATTEVDKLPVTVLSRCMRFDLRRIPTAMLAAHFAKICAAENVRAEPEALNMIAEAAEGSVRDGLSILDQAIAHSDLVGADLARDEVDTAVTAAQVLDMLGLADKSVQRRLFAAILTGDGTALLDLVAHQFALGIEPIALMRAMMALTHRITVAQLGRSGAEGSSVEAVSADDRSAVENWAQSLGAGQLHRLWQLLLKGHDEVRSAPDPLIATEMALLRCLHAADLPDPGALARRLDELAARPAGLSLPPITAVAEPSPPALASSTTAWAELVQSVENAGCLQVAQIMRDWVRVVTLAPGDLRFALVPGYSGDPATELATGLFKTTGERWQVERVEANGMPALRELAEAAKAATQAARRRSPLVTAAFAAFPDAEIIEDPGAYAGRNGS